MLADVDVLLVDIQDVGSRAYTYISTLAEVMQAAHATGKEVWVLDRPNPLGDLVDQLLLVRVAGEEFFCLGGGDLFRGESFPSLKDLSHLLFDAGQLLV